MHKDKNMKNVHNSKRPLDRCNKVHYNKNEIKKASERN